MRVKDSPWPKPGANEVHLSPSQLAKLTKKFWEQGRRWCWLCKKYINKFEDYTLDHKQPASGVGCKRDSREENLAPAHKLCNLNKGSKRICS